MLLKYFFTKIILNNYNGGDVPSDDVLLASDMNEDDVIDVSDVVLLINEKPSEKKRIRRRKKASNVDPSAVIKTKPAT